MRPPQTGRHRVAVTDHGTLLLLVDASTGMDGPFYRSCELYSFCVHDRRTIGEKFGIVIVGQALDYFMPVSTLSFCFLLFSYRYFLEQREIDFNKLYFSPVSSESFNLCVSDRRILREAHNVELFGSSLFAMLSLLCIFMLLSSWGKRN